MPNRFDADHPFDDDDDKFDLKADLEDSSRMSDIAIRKKKNADAQAAFRQRFIFLSLTLPPFSR